MANDGDSSDITSVQSGHPVSATTTLFGQQFSDDSGHPQYPVPSVGNWQGLEHHGHHQQSFNTWRGLQGQGNLVEYPEDTRGNTTQAAASEGQNFHDHFASTHSRSNFSWLNPLANPPLYEGQRPDTRSQDPAMPNKCDRMRVQSSVNHGHGHSQEQQHASHRAARAGSRSQAVNQHASSEDPVSANQNLTQAATQAFTGVPGRRTQVSGISRQSPQEAIWTSNGPQTFNAEPNRNQPNIRPMSIQLQRFRSVSAKVATPSPSMPKLPSSTRWAPISGGNASTIRCPNATRLASDSTNITTSQASDLPLSAIEYKLGYKDPTQDLNSYHKDHNRRRNGATPAATAQDARARVQPLSNAFHSDIQADQADEKESDIAAEMKALLDKMNVLRQKDPTMFQKLWDEAGNLADSSTISVDQSSFAESRQQAHVPASQKTAVISAHPVVKAFSHVSQPKGLKQASYLTTDLHHAQAGDGHKYVLENYQKALPGTGNATTKALKLKKKTAERSTVDLTASRGPSSQAGSASNESGSLRRPGSASNNVPAAVPAPAASGDDEFIKSMRIAVAKTIVVVLQSAPENNAMDITTDEIYSMLEDNPPYVQLCDNLEKRGFKFHRVRLARQLVASVPGLSKSNTAKVTAVPPNTSPMAPPATTTMPISTTRPALLVPADGHPVTNGSLASPMVAVPISSKTMVASCTARPSTSERPEGSKPVNRARKQVPSAPPEHSPGPKEMLSRKRDFSELVDLTQLSDNDDYVLSNKHVQVESSPLDSRLVGKNQHVANMQHRPLAPRLQDWKGTTHPTTNTPWRPGQPQEEKTILAKPINKIDAVRKQYYDPKTVARDILIAAGRHPYQRPLNAHMAPLLDKYINIDSDLSTFDWDAIDPGGPPVPKVAPVNIPAAAPRIRMQWKRHAGHRKQRIQMGEDGDSEKRRRGINSA